MILAASPSVTTLVLFALAIVAALVVMYLFGFSKLRQGTTVLQEQTNNAQAQLIEAMQLELEKMKSELGTVKIELAQQRAENVTLREEVTNAAKVDALREDVSTGFDRILEAITGRPPQGALSR